MAETIGSHTYVESRSRINLVEAKAAEKDHRLVCRVYDQDGNEVREAFL